MAGLAGSILLAACGGGEKIVKETVIVEKIVEKIVEVEKEVEKVVVATPTAAAEAAPSGGGGGDLIVGVPAVCPPIFNNRFLTGACFERVAMWGFTEGLTWMADAPIPIQVDEENEAKSMVESWNWDEGANTLTWVIKTGIPFHEADFGDVTGADVAFSFNEAMAEGSTFNRAGQLRAWIAPPVTADGQTVTINCTDAGCQKDWIRQQSNYNGQTASITSQKAFDTLGEEKSLGHLGNMTGPFHATKWVTNEVIESVAVDPHWRHTPFVASMKFVEIPETSVRLAAISNGEVHLADLPPRFVAQAAAAMGGRSQQMGGGRGQGIYFAGNYWATTDYLGAAGEGNDPAARPGYKPDDEHPWIGEWGNDESMERARKIRVAMALMVDRDRINDKILGGLGSPSYSYYGWTPAHPEWKDEWKLDYDVDQAKALLDEAGFGDGFDVPLWVVPDVASVWDPEITEAIAQMWTDAGLSPKIVKTAYSAQRPNLVSRTIDHPWSGTGDGENTPKDTNAVGGHVPRAGAWGSGVELPDEIGKLWQTIEDEREPAKKREINAEVSDFMNKWRLQFFSVESIPFWAVRPEVTAWEPYTGNLPYFGNPQTIKMAK